MPTSMDTETLRDIIEAARRRGVRYTPGKRQSKNVEDRRGQPFKQPEPIEEFLNLMVRAIQSRLSKGTQRGPAGSGLTLPAARPDRAVAGR